MNQRVLTIGSAVIIAAVFGALLLGAADPPTESISETEILMRAKLTSSQKVLEGLLAEDYQLIAQGAREMKRISEAVQSSHHQDEVYEHFASEFRRQCTELERLAKQTHHEGASFSYLHLTRTCINCHDYLREELHISVRPEGGVQLIPTQIPEH